MNATHDAPAASDSSSRTPYDLIRRCQAIQDSEAWPTLCDRYKNLIYSEALKFGLSAEDAADVAQETFTWVFKKMTNFKADPAAGSFRSWLLQAVRWHSLNLIKKRRRNERFLRVNPGSAPSDSTPTIEKIPALTNEQEALWDAEWQGHILDLALHELKKQVKDKDYQVFFLHVIKQHPATEVARLLKVNPGQVYLNKFRVRRKFERILKALQEKIL